MYMGIAKNTASNCDIFTHFNISECNFGGVSKLNLYYLTGMVEL